MFGSLTVCLSICLSIWQIGMKCDAHRVWHKCTSLNATVEYMGRVDGMSGDPPPSSLPARRRERTIHRTAVKDTRGPADPRPMHPPEAFSPHSAPTQPIHSYTHTHTHTAGLSTRVSQTRQQGSQAESQWRRRYDIYRHKLTLHEKDATSGGVNCSPRELHVM